MNDSGHWLELLCQPEAFMGRRGAEWAALVRAVSAWKEWEAEESWRCRYPAGRRFPPLGEACAAGGKAVSGGNSPRTRRKAWLAPVAGFPAGRCQKSALPAAMGSPVLQAGERKALAFEEPEGRTQAESDCPGDLPWLKTAFPGAAELRAEWEWWDFAAARARRRSAGPRLRALPGRTGRGLRQPAAVPAEFWRPAEFQR
jgi:hypothetical protein